ncbi:hypothetical protein L9F63_020508, partial [Diploptera punctata]
RPKEMEVRNVDHLLMVHSRDKEEHRSGTNTYLSQGKNVLALHFVRCQVRPRSKYLIMSKDQKYKVYFTKASTRATSKSILLHCNHQSMACIL